MREIIFALWFFLPAGVANMAPVFAANVPGLKRLNAPLDFGLKLHSKPLLGAHKTWRGLAAGIVVAMATVWLQQLLVRYYGWFGAEAAHIHYLSMPVISLGPALAFGALGGDAVKSFVKRRKNIPAGGVWLPYDLIDHIVGAALLALPFVVFAWWTYIAVLAFWPFSNLAISYAGYLLHLKERPL